MIAVVVSANPCAVWAHAVIVESTPGINGVVKGPAVDIKLRFNSRVDASRSKLTLISPDGVAHAIKLSRQKSPDALLATAPNLLPGKYQLRWQVLASDGHITQGEIPFSVIAP